MGEGAGEGGGERDFCSWARARARGSFAAGDSGNLARKLHQLSCRRCIMRKKQTSKTAKMVVKPAAKQVETSGSLIGTEKRTKAPERVQTAEGWRRHMLR